VRFLWRFYKAFAGSGDDSDGVRLSWTELAASRVEENKGAGRSSKNRKLIDFVNFSWGSYFLEIDTVGGMHYPTGYQWK